MVTVVAGSLLFVVLVTEVVILTHPKHGPFRFSLTNSFE
jgi:hypothetical protein